MKRGLKYLATTFLIMLTLAGYLWHRLGAPHGAQKTVNTKQIPTLFIHGYLGNRASFGLMLHRFEQNGWGQKSAVMRITKDGELKVSGNPKLPDGFIQVIFTDNTHNVTTQARWLWTIMSTLRLKYGVKEVNIVAHSMGGVTVMRYLSLYGSASNVAQVAKVVSLGAPYNDYETGKSSKEIENLPLTKKGPKVMTPLYRKIKQHSDHISAKIHFLNIMGDLQNGTHSDGEVSINSAASLRYLLRKQRYEEMIIKGKKAAHSLLHENRQIDQKIGKFLFDAN